MNGNNASVFETRNKYDTAKRPTGFFELIDRIAKTACMVLLGAMALVIFLQVFGRFFLPTPFCWTEELARYLMVWGAFIGSSSMIKTWENIYVDIIIERLPLKVKKRAYLLIKLIIFVFMIYVTYITLKVLPQIGFFQTTPALGIPMFFAHLGMMIGFVLIVTQLLGTILHDIFGGGKS